MPRLTDLLLRLRMPRLGRPPPFPADFFFGVATSDHQCEAYEEKWEDIRDRWEKLDNRTPRGRATDFWIRHPEDIERARDLGCRAFRFSVAWTRVEPEPGRFDQEVLKHYRGMVDRIVAAGMIPIVTLHHFTWPLHVENRGGMTSPAFPGWFAEYAEHVAEALGPEVGYWITFNEPTYLPFGFLKLWGSRSYLLPPGMGHATGDEQVRAAAALVRNLFVAHREARERIRARHPEGKVGTNPFVLGFPTWLQSWLDRHATAERNPEAWLRRERHKLGGYPDLVAGVIDVMFGAFARTPEREREMLFSEGYAEGQPSLLVAVGDAARSVKDLNGAKIAVVRGSNAVEVMERCGLTFKPCWRLSLDRSIRSLRRGDVRAVMSDDILLAAATTVESERWRILPFEVQAQRYAAAVGLNRESLLREVDAAVREVLELSGKAKPDNESRLGSVGTAASSGPAAVAEPGPSTEKSMREGVEEAAATKTAASPRTVKETWLSSDPIAGVQRRGQLIVGVRRGGSPFAWRDRRTGEWKGIEADIARALARRLLGDEKRVRFLAIDPFWRSSLLRGFWIRPIEFFHRLVTLFSTMANTDWWYLGMAGRLPAFLCPRECVGQMDFVGFDYYWGIPELRWDRIRALFDSIQGQYASAPVHPGGLGRLLKRYARAFPGKEIVIIENGCIESADGIDRSDYLRTHLWEVQKAIAAGVPVKGHVCWSITSNREWGQPFGPHSDFGIYHVDLDRDPDLKRVPTPAAEVLRQIVHLRDAVPTDAQTLREWMRKVGVHLKDAPPA